MWGLGSKIQGQNNKMYRHSACTPLTPSRDGAAVPLSEGAAAGAPGATNASAEALRRGFELGLADKREFRLESVIEGVGPNPNAKRKPPTQSHKTSEFVTKPGIWNTPTPSPKNLKPPTRRPRLSPKPDNLKPDPLEPLQRT